MGCVCLHYLLCINALTCTDVHDMYLLHLNLFRNIYRYSYTDIFTHVLYYTHFGFMTLGFLIATTPVSGICHQSLAVRAGHGHTPNSRDCCNSTSVLYSQSKDSDSITEVWLVFYGSQTSELYQVGDMLIQSCFLFFSRWCLLSTQDIGFLVAEGDPREVSFSSWFSENSSYLPWNWRLAPENGWLEY